MRDRSLQRTSQPDRRSVNVERGEGLHEVEYKFGSTSLLLWTSFSHPQRQTEQGRGFQRVQC